MKDLHAHGTTVPEHAASPQNGPIHRIARLELKQRSSGSQSAVVAQEHFMAARDIQAGQERDRYPILELLFKLPRHVRFPAGTNASKSIQRWLEKLLLQCRPLFLFKDRSEFSQQGSTIASVGTPMLTRECRGTERCQTL